MSMRAIFFILFVLIGCFKLNAQEISENDSLPSRFILILPTADNTKLTAVKNALQDNQQVLSAVFVYKNHNALLVELADVVNPKLIYYREIMKLVAHGFKYEEILIKDPSAFDQIKSDVEANSTTFIVK